MSTTWRVDVGRVSLEKFNDQKETHRLTIDGRQQDLTYGDVVDLFRVLCAGAVSEGGLAALRDLPEPP